MSCDKAPEGWQCSREQGHNGPCAARVVNNPMSNSYALKRLREISDQLANMVIDLQIVYDKLRPDEDKEDTSLCWEPYCEDKDRQCESACPVCHYHLPYCACV